MDLAALGISLEQERTYRLLVTHGRRTPADVAADLGLEVREAVALLASLVESGLVMAQDGGYRAAPPELALRGLLVQRRDDLRRTEATLAQLAAEFRSGQGEDSVRTLVEVVVGPEEVRRRFIQVQRAASTRVRAFVRPDHTVVAAEENTAESEAVARGVSYQIVLERSMLEQPGMLERVADTVAAGEQVRATDDVPLRMLIADEDVALIPLETDGQVGAAVVRRSSLLQALIALFEQTWERSPDVALTLGEGQELDERIVALLLQGYGDKSISTQLAVSPRTVQRRVRVLMDQAGATSRIQLGFWLGRGAQG